MAPVNVLWIFVDQLRVQSLSCHGDPNVRTPNIDRLAAEGVDLTRAFSTCPICTPARGCVMTGQYPSTNGILYLGDLLLPQQPTAAHAFRRAGYRTSYVGKWHLASQQNPFGHNEGAEYWVHPLLRGGFEDWFGFELSNHFWKTRYATGDRIWPPLEIEGYQTDGLTSLSLEYLGRTARRLDQPWFHVLSLEAPHHGRDRHGKISVTVGEHKHVRHPAPAEYEDRFDPQAIMLRDNVPAGHEAVARSQQAQYCAMIENLDDNIGRLLGWLEETGLDKTTLVAFFSDHGEMGGSQGRFQKTSPYAESIGVPLIMRLPMALPAGRTVTAPANLVDIFPTTAALCGVPVPAEVQGVDLSETLNGKTPPPREATLTEWFGNPRYSPDPADANQWRAVCTERHTYAVYQDGTGLLFDDEADPNQLENRFNDPSCADLRLHLHNLLYRELLRDGEVPPHFVRPRYTR